MTQGARHRVVVVGAGFGGLYAARALRKADVDVTVVNGTNHHVFEPLLYQVAAGVLSPGEVAVPVRAALRRQRNAEVRLGWVTAVDTGARVVTVEGPGSAVAEVPYDTLIVAAGATGSYFGNDGFAEHAPGLKSVDDALELRARIFGAFEAAEALAAGGGARTGIAPAGTAPATASAAVARQLTFVVVGAGPTGVEMAGQIAEIGRRGLAGQFRHIDPGRARVVLVDAVDRVLPTFHPAISAKADRRLRAIGVEVRLGARVVDVDATGVKIDTGAGGERIEAATKVWAAGVAGTGLARALARDTGAPIDRAGRILVEPDLTVPGHPEIFVLGEAMSLDGLPGVAQVAMQGGTHAGRTIARRVEAAATAAPEPKPFKYFDKGNMAAVSRWHAVADLGPVRVGGPLGWLMWLAVHLFYLHGMRNRLTVGLRQLVSFVGRTRSEAVFTPHQTNHRRTSDRQANDRQANDRQANDRRAVRRDSPGAG